MFGCYASGSFQKSFQMEWKCGCKMKVGQGEEFLQLKATIEKIILQIQGLAIRMKFTLTYSYSPTIFASAVC